MSSYHISLVLQRPHNQPFFAAMELDFMKNITEKVLNEIAHSNGFTNPRLEFSLATKKADNFVGQIIRCLLTDRDNPAKQLHLIVKLPPADYKERLSTISVGNLFRTEAHMYGTVLPALADCYKKKNPLLKDVLFPYTARTYALIAEDEDNIIVMEDMKEKEFVMQNRHVGLDENHTRFVLRRMARIHAASLALQRDYPELHDSLTGRLTENLFAREQLHKYFTHSIERFRGAIDDRFPIGSPIRNKVEGFLVNYNMNMKKIVGKNSTLCCITHADLWVNNMLFKYEKGSDSIEDVCFLDYQISRYCTPVTDIWYFLSLCTRKSTRKSYNDLIKCYHESLCSSLKDLGHDPEEIVPWNLLQEELRKYGSYGWATAVIILPPILIEEAQLEMIEKKLREDSSARIDLPDQAKIRFIELLEEAEELGFF